MNQRLCLGAIVLLSCAAPAPACSVPVFRYALERWSPDAYEAVIFHRGPLTAADRSLVKQLDNAGLGSGKRAILDVATVDLDKETDAAMTELWDAQTKAALPWLVLRMPRSVKKQPQVWAGKLSQGALDAVLQSPVRKEIGQRILKGESAVWVLLECGDREQDDAAAKLLGAELKKLQTTLKLPELKANDPSDKIEVGPQAPELKISFSLIRLSRSNPAEQALVQMLLHVEDDLATLAGPMAFPVFGRGRALEPMVNKGITDENIKDMCTFIIGKCGCEVKRLNPGTDLLMATDWERIFERASPADTPKPATDDPAPPATQPETIAAPANPSSEETADPANSTALPLLFGVLLGGLAGTVALTFALGKRKRGD